MSAFGDFLKHCRKEQNMTMNEVCTVAGISQPSLSHYEKGLKKATYPTLKKLADLYGVSHEEMIKRSEDMHIEVAESEKPTKVHRFTCNNGHMFFIPLFLPISIEQMVSLLNVVQCPVCHCGSSDIAFNMKEYTISE